jgi:hypothetical protein
MPDIDEFSLLISLLTRELISLLIRVLMSLLIKSLIRLLISLQLRVIKFTEFVSLQIRVY